MKSFFAFALVAISATNVSSLNAMVSASSTAILSDATDQACDW